MVVSSKEIYWKKMSYMLEVWTSKVKGTITIKKRKEIKIKI